MIAAQNPNAGPNASVLLYIALSFGFSLCVNVWVFFRISGGLFNPAVISSENKPLTRTDKEIS
jgi:aquaporin related protein